MPIRFNSSSLGEGSVPQLKAHQWQIDFTYRYLPGGPWYVGTQATPSAAPHGQPVHLHINSFELSVDYGVTDRFNVTLDVPFQYATQSYVYPDLHYHEVSAGGLGDIGFYGTYWLLNPKKHLTSNVSVSLGVKTPSGNNEVMGNFWNANGSVTRAPVDQSIQLGDGGWGVTFQAQGYKQLFHRTTGYANGLYLLSPKDATNVPSPVSGAVLSVPDVYSARAGMAYAISPEHGLSASLGVRIDGIPVDDIAGKSDGFRRPGYNLYIDPGVSYVHGRNIFAVNLPASVYQDFKHSNLDVKIHRVGGGDLATYLVLAQYSYRF
jgi:hypothetical protein